MSVFTNPASGAKEQAAAYTSAVLELLGDREPTAVLREMLSALPRAVEGLSPQQLREPERPGKWSIGQILQHLSDSEVVWAWRMRLILAQDRPQLTGTTRICGRSGSITTRWIRRTHSRCSRCFGVGTCGWWTARPRRT